MSYSESVAVGRNYAVIPTVHGSIRFEHITNFMNQLLEYTYSVEVQVYTKEQLDLFDDWLSEYLAYNRKRMMDPTNLVFITETRRLREQIVRMFGTDIWYLDLP